LPLSHQQVDLTDAGIALAGLERNLLVEQPDRTAVGPGQSSAVHAECTGEMLLPPIASEPTRGRTCMAYEVLFTPYAPLRRRRPKASVLDR
jgi:hypothetical protein